MDYCEFSETQFESYHSRQLENMLGSTFHQYFPTRNEEANLGYDLVHYTIGHSIFIQYKVAPNLSVKNKKCASLTGNFYRMSIYNNLKKGKSGQYRLLWDLAGNEDHVYYVTPEFHTNLEFSTNYRDIMNYSAHFKLRGNFKNPHAVRFNSHKHYLYYSNNSNFGKMYSNEFEEINKGKILNIITTSKPLEVSFAKYLIKLKNEIFEILKQNKIEGIVSQKRDILLEKLIYKGKQNVYDDFFVCNYFLKKYFDLNWTVTLRKNT
jgi:hypothetical protein